MENLPKSFSERVPHGCFPYIYNIIHIIHIVFFVSLWESQINLSTRRRPLTRLFACRRKRDRSPGASGGTFGGKPGDLPESQMVSLDTGMKKMDENGISRLQYQSIVSIAYMYCTTKCTYLLQ